MPSIIQAGNAASTGLVTTGATDGILELRSGTASGGTVAMTVDAAGVISTPLGANFATTSGNVGIGTSAPVVPLDVRGPVGIGMRFRNTASGLELATRIDATTVGLDAGNTSGGMTFSANSVERMRMLPAGGLLVGCTSLPNASVAGFGINVSDGAGDSSIVCSGGADTGGNRQIAFFNGNGMVGSVTTSGTGTSFNTSSDYRLKNITGPVTGSGAFIDALKPCKGSWKADDSVFVGFLAHEFQEVSPVSVSGAKDEARVEQYEVTPAVVGVTAVEASEGVEAVTGIEAAPAVMGERTVPVMQGMQASSSEVMANIVAEIQSLRLRLAPLEVVIQEQQALIESLTTRLTALEGSA